MHLRESGKRGGRERKSRCGDDQRSLHRRKSNYQPEAAQISLLSRAACLSIRRWPTRRCDERSHLSCRVDWIKARMPDGRRMPARELLVLPAMRA
jgi:hypothetical protein